MSAQPTYEPLRLTPPLEQRSRMAWLLTVRRLARRALDAALAAPRSAAQYVGRLYRSTRLVGVGSWLRGLTGRIIQPVLTTTSRLGKTGVIAGLLTLATSPIARRLLHKAGGSCLRPLSWLARTASTGIDRGLRLFGKAGNRAADALFALVVTVGGRVAAVASPVVHRIARFADPQTPHIRVLAGISRSYFLHRALQALISNGLVRLLVEGMLIPTFMDSRIACWVHRQVQILRTRAACLQEQAVTVPDLPAEARNGRTRPSGGESSRDPSVLSPDRALPLIKDDEPRPSNRAERRAQERHVNKQGRTNQ